MHCTEKSDEFGFDQPVARDALSTMKWEAEILRKGDPDLLCLGAAEMDFRAAPAVLDAIRRVADAGHFGYPLKRASYFEAIVGYFARRFSWEIDRSWIASNVGIYPAMQPIIEEFSRPGDEILYQPPVHHIFREVVESAGRVAIANPLSARSGRYEMDFEDLMSKITPQTWLFLLCSPHNPVARVWTQAELTKLCEICAAHNIVVVADEVYCGLVYPGVRFTPYAAVANQAQMSSITLVSASKSFNLTGLKHSLVIVPNPTLRDAYMTGLKRNNLLFGGCVFGQAATEAAFRDCDDWADAVIKYIRANFVHLRSFMKTNLPWVGVTEPEATYFAWLDFRELNLGDNDLRALIEDNARVCVTMGEPMGPGGAGHIRLNLATQRSVLDDALNRLARACARHLAAPSRQQS